MVTIDKRGIRLAKAIDLVARIVITFGGVLTIASVILIILLIVGVTLPLFLGATAELVSESSLPEAIAGHHVVAVGVDRVELERPGVENADSVTGYVLTDDGRCTFLDFMPEEPSTGDSAEPAAAKQLPYDVLGTIEAAPPGDAMDATVVGISRAGGSRHCLLWSDGSISLVEPALVPQYDEFGRRSVRHDLKTLAAFPPEEEGKTVAALAWAEKTAEVESEKIGGQESPGSKCSVKLLEDNRIVVVRESISKGLEGLGIALGPAEATLTRNVIDTKLPGKIRSMTLDGKGEGLYAGTDNGYLLRWKLNDQGKVVDQETVRAFADGRAITALAVVYGDIALAVGDGQGNLTVWFPTRVGSEGGDSDDASAKERRQLELVHTLSSHAGPIEEIIPSERSKALLSRGADGSAHLDYTTSERHLLTVAEDAPLEQMGYAPRGNAMVGLDSENRLVVWDFDWQLSDNPHPEVSWKALLGKVHYENHDEAKYMWQSSGTDEPKYSIVPVLFGTMKATLYALLFAGPLALFSAMYVSYFTTPAFKRAIKPIVEVMAAIPTVVVGFLILLWAAPLVGKWIVAVFLAMLLIPIAFVLFMLVWQFVRRYDWAKWIENGYEFLVLVPVIALSIAIASALAPTVEQTLFVVKIKKAPQATTESVAAGSLSVGQEGDQYEEVGDFRQWLFQKTGVRYEQLNSLVVAFGLGFAVIPIIFSISEDALSSIPYEMTAASLAVGASRWQTVWRVVLPSASPGVFAAMMIGFGRAVGETMIVFMAAGNTPLMSWSPLNGFRTLSANIAVEIPEADYNSTLYRVLFLCAVLLFLLTFLLNTAAELVRTHLRKKFGQY